VLNAPYHRNDEGIARAMGIFRASPEEAHARLQSLEADYLVDCPGGNAVGTHARHAPDSLAARLQANKVPAWLEPLDLPHDDAAPIKVYRIAAPGPRA